jgi:two-component system chemotaxis response regulator CheB
VPTIRIAVVDDSIFVRKALMRILGSDPRIEVVGAAGSGEELLANLDRWRPDLVSLDLSMPGMGGLRTLDELMARRPTPVIVLSTLARESAPLTIEALHRGAVDFIDKQQFSMVDFTSISKVLLEKIFEIVGPRDSAEPHPSPPAPRDRSRAPEIPLAAARLVLIGASTGGPPALQTLLEALGDDFVSPVVIVQHMPAGFTAAFAERLDARLPMSVKEAEDGEAVKPASVYLAPGGRHLELAPGDEGVLLTLVEPRPEEAHTPSVDRLFTSALELEPQQLLAVLLTGMGRDGARGMAALAARGAYTLAQDEASSVVFGMPRAAIEAGAVSETLPLARIGGRLRELVLAR